MVGPLDTHGGLQNSSTSIAFMMSDLSVNPRSGVVGVRQATWPWGARLLEHDGIDSMVASRNSDKHREMARSISAFTFSTEKSRLGGSLP
ncbi:MAG: hypothetical protein Ct9H300mP8_02610 [Gammaproteobacteria bacterium]|nr:MAG: hypothetical protein Ct9H300mP8_02610 [Gammaproteobacteria bacterium]